MKNSFPVLILALLIQAGVAQAQIGGGGEANPLLKTHPESLESFRDMRFGMFVHWGPVSLRGEEISWSRGISVPQNDYDSLYREFNPILFDASQWAQTASEAGMKYLVITARHHDGFCLWDSEHTQYDIMSSPYQQDIVRALSEACKKEGLALGIYYSVCDWHHPAYPTELPATYRHSGNEILKENADMKRYVTYMKNQLGELVNRYDPAIIWFDGEWERHWTHAMGMDLYAYLRGLKNDLLINNRVDKGRRGMSGITADTAKFAGDYDTPEQEIGKLNLERPWESCITIGRQWAWKPNDELKSKKELLKTLLQTAGGDGNLLLNVGPMPDGRIEKRQKTLLAQMGQWLNVHGEAVYGTRGGPYQPTDYLASTRRENKIYLHLLDPDKTQFSLPFPGDVKITSASLLHNGQAVSFDSDGPGLKLRLPPSATYDFRVIVLELDEDAMHIAPLERMLY